MNDRLGAPLQEHLRQRPRLFLRPGDQHPLAQERATLKQIEPAQALAQSNHGAEDGDGRRGDPGFLRPLDDVRQRADHHPLPWRRPPLHHRRGRVGRLPRVQEPTDDAGHVAHAHHHHQRVHPRQRAPIVLVLRTVPEAMARYDGGAPGDDPVGDGNPGVLQRRNGRGDTGDELEGDSGGFQRQPLLAAPPEDERIATFQPHDPLSLTAEPNQQIVDLLLGCAVGAGSLADVVQFGVRARPSQDGAVDEGIEDDGVRFAQELPAPQGEQFRVARPGPNDVNDPSHQSLPRTASRKPTYMSTAPRSSLR